MNWIQDVFTDYSARAMRCEGGGEWCSREVGSCKGGRDRCLRWRGIGSRGISSRSIWRVFMEGMVSGLCCEGSPSWEDYNCSLDVLEDHWTRLGKVVLERVRGRFIFYRRKTCLIKSYMSRNIYLIWYGIKTSIATISFESTKYSFLSVFIYLFIWDFVHTRRF